MMRIEEIMTRNPEFCDLNTSLADAAQKMWHSDCGVLPVLKDCKEIVGVITDRDICMALAMGDFRPTALSVEKVINGLVYKVAPTDDVNTALKLMKKHRVRRLPVVNGEGELEGMVSLNDIFLNTHEASETEPAPINYVDAVNTYKAICAHPLPETQAQTAVAAG